ncbi:hypothetical protein B296_00053156 [Ensete ventricosum]|uniref:Uncharacterized protein n=1 Tax=Ensete ventricosum TaxID=4639 RepID=A0A426Y9F8_ENSVE|nr:hypothetical protein B296_00053156 [Ensete ventricosum]
MMTNWPRSVSERVQLTPLPWVSDWKPGPLLSSSPPSGLGVSVVEGLRPTIAGLHPHHSGLGAFAMASLHPIVTGLHLYRSRQTDRQGGRQIVVDFSYLLRVQQASRPATP